MFSGSYFFFVVGVGVKEASVGGEERMNKDYSSEKLEADVEERD